MNHSPLVLQGAAPLTCETIYLPADADEVRSERLLL
jgi:hypothetical protein